MTPTIRIDDEVFAELQKHALPLVDSPNSVLRRLLRLDSASFRAKPLSDPLSSTADDPTLELDGPGYSARGRDGQDSFWVLQGSLARRTEVPSIPPRVSKKRRELLDHGVVVEEAGGYRFVKNYSFGSPSAAACAVVGGSEDGLRAWKDLSGRSLKEIRRHTSSPDGCGDGHPDFPRQGTLKGQTRRNSAGGPASRKTAASASATAALRSP